MPITVRVKTYPDRLRWLLRKLDESGDDEVVRFGVASVLLAIAAEMELPAHSDGLRARRGRPAGR